MCCDLKFESSAAVGECPSSISFLEGEMKSKSLKLLLSSFFCELMILLLYVYTVTVVYLLYNYPLSDVVNIIILTRKRICQFSKLFTQYEWN